MSLQAQNAPKHVFGRALARTQREVGELTRSPQIPQSAAEGHNSFCSPQRLRRSFLACRPAHLHFSNTPLPLSMPPILRPHPVPQYFPELTYITYDFLFASRNEYVVIDCTVSEIQRDVGQPSQFFFCPYMHLVPLNIDVQHDLFYCQKSRLTRLSCSVDSVVK